MATHGHAEQLTYTLKMNPIKLVLNSFHSRFADMAPIPGLDDDFYREFMLESKKLWFLAGQGIFSFVSKYSLGAFTQIFSGHIGTIELTVVY